MRNSYALCYNFRQLPNSILRLAAASTLVVLIVPTATEAAENFFSSEIFAHRDWFREQNHVFNERFAKSPNRAAVEAWLEKKFSGATRPFTKTLRSGDTLKLVRDGFSGPTRLILEHDGAAEVLFSNFDVKKNHTIGIKEVVVSGDEKSAAIVMYEKGSIDGLRLSILDLAAKKMRHENIEMQRESVVWASNLSLLYTAKVGSGEQVKSLDIQSGKSAGAGSTLIKGKADWSAIRKSDGTMKLFSNQGETFLAPQLNIREIGGRLGDNLLFLSGAENGSIASVSIAANKRNAKTIYEKQNRVVKGIEPTTDGKAMIATSHWGAEQFAVLIRDDGSKIDEIPLPDCCSFVSATLAPNGKSVAFGLKSPFEEKREFVYDLENKLWEDSELSKKMLTFKGIEMLTEVVEVTSDDGTKIPMRITRRKDLKANGENPVIMRAYGGFMQPGQIYPNWDSMHAEFVLLGGILAGPGLRGGNEFGRKWWEDAKNINKVRTIDDLVASANWLAASRLTKPELIITRGASNGGFVVSAAALRSPGSFGLVFPIVGVYDTESIDSLDTRNSAYWQSEYGDPTDERVREAMREIAPVVQAEKTPAIPRMVVISALNDSRVNYLHSMRLGRALLRNENEGVKGKFEVVTLKNAGHFLYIMPYQDLIAFRTNSIIWSTIFDHIGWNLSP